MQYSECEIGIDENNPTYWANMAFSLQRDAKPEKAEKYYKKALELDPDNAIYLINLGYVLSEQQKNEEAINYLRYAVNISPDFVEGWIKSEYMMVRDDSPIGEAKHAVLKKGSGWTVDEVDNGFASNDKYLQEIIETYWYFKNLGEFRDLEHELHKENEIMDMMAKDSRELHWHWSDH